MPTDQSALQGFPVRDALRLQTNEAHQRLHRHSCFLRLSEGTLCLSEYRRLVLRLHGFYAPLDQAIGRVAAGAISARIPYSYANRSNILAQDLADLGFNDRAVKKNQRCMQIFDLVTPASLGGVLYVVEGATLGGTGIDRAVHKLLGQEETDGRQFWAWCRAVNKQRWSMTTSYLEHLNSEGVPFEDIANGARDTFQLLAGWLAPLDTSPWAADGNSL